jgi:hypothetical protein
MFSTLSLGSRTVPNNKSLLAKYHFTILMFPFAPGHVLSTSFENLVIQVLVWINSTKAFSISTHLLCHLAVRFSGFTCFDILCPSFILIFGWRIKYQYSSWKLCMVIGTAPVAWKRKRYFLFRLIFIFYYHIVALWMHSAICKSAYGIY